MPIAEDHIQRMSLRPLYGFAELRQRLSESVRGGLLPASLLLQGPRGVGKQRLALWLGQLLLCDRATTENLVEPCDTCMQCRYALRLQHPDLHWFFPRPKVKDSDVDIEDVKEDMRVAIVERMSANGLWSTPSGAEGIPVVASRALVQMAVVRPAMAKRAVFVVGDAERMVMQAGTDQAANAFLKLLEEPPRDTTIVLTSSEPGALLPTIKSRVVSIRVPLAGRSAVEALLDDPVFAARTLKKSEKRLSRAEALDLAAGAPGMLLGVESIFAAFATAHRMLDAALAPVGPAGAADRLKVAAKQGAAGARGPFTDALKALTVLLHKHTRDLALAGHKTAARRAAQGIVSIERTREKAHGNVSPQLLSASLLASLHELLSQ